jgi:trk system potassium uptake protein TrkA
MYIVVVGGGKVGYNLTKFLLSEGHEVLLIEKEKVRAAALSDTLNEAVLEGNGSRVGVLQEAGGNRANVLIAVTGNDEDNLVICQIAKAAFKCPRTIARVNDPNNEALFSALGVDATVNATRLIDALIEEQVKADNMVIPLLTLGKDIQIIEIDLTPTSVLIGQSVAQIRLPEGAILIAILRGEEVVIPQPETILEKEDKVVALVKKEVEQTLREMF